MISRPLWLQGGALNVRRFPRARRQNTYLYIYMISIQRCSLYLRIIVSTAPNHNTLCPYMDKHQVTQYNELQTMFHFIGEDRTDFLSYTAR